MSWSASTLIDPPTNDLLQKIRGAGSTPTAPTARRIYKRWSPSEISAARAEVLTELEGPPEEEALFDRLVAMKMSTAAFSPHLEREWRAGLFKQLDGMLDVEEWLPSDRMPSVASFKTLMRMMLHNDVKKVPSLGATQDGKVIASWRDGSDRLVVECLDNDQVRWVATRCFDGQPARGAGTSSVSFLRTALQPYEAERWFG